MSDSDFLDPTLDAVLESGPTLSESIDDFVATANRIADQLIAARTEHEDYVKWATATILKEKSAWTGAAAEIGELRARNTSLETALIASMHALRSYQYGNSSEELAKSVADAAAKALGVQP